MRRGPGHRMCKTLHFLPQKVRLTLNKRTAGEPMGDGSADNLDTEGLDPSHCGIHRSDMPCPQSCEGTINVAVALRVMR